MRITVAWNGSADYKSIQKAVDSIPDTYAGRVEIFIKCGIYFEPVVIERPEISLIGENRDQTVIVFNKRAKQKENGAEIGTFRTQTVWAKGDGFRCENVTIANSAGQGKIVGQAVALSIGGDIAVIKNCRITGCQDTLFVGSRADVRNYFESCIIQGDVDFIFGSAYAVFKNCEIISNNRYAECNGYIAAPSTHEGQEYGMVFIGCDFTHEDCAEESVYLARPWRNCPKAYFINCKLGPHISKHKFFIDKELPVDFWEKDLPDDEAVKYLSMF